MMNPVNTLSPRMAPGLMAQAATGGRVSNALLVAIMACCALLADPLSLRAADTVTGNLLLIAKAEVEVYHNGRKIVLRDQSDDKQQFRVKVPQRVFKAG